MKKIFSTENLVCYGMSTLLIGAIIAVIVIVTTTDPKSLPTKTWVNISTNYFGCGPVPLCKCIGTFHMLQYVKQIYSYITSNIFDL